MGALVDAMYLQGPQAGRGERIGILLGGTQWEGGRPFPESIAFALAVCMTLGRRCLRTKEQFPLK